MPLSRERLCSRDDSFPTNIGGLISLNTRLLSAARRFSTHEQFLHGGGLPVCPTCRGGKKVSIKSQKRSFGFRQVLHPNSIRVQRLANKCIAIIIFSMENKYLSIIKKIEK